MSRPECGARSSLLKKRLRPNELLNLPAVGGIKLGTGGLVRAYGGSLNEVIKITEFFEYKKLENHILECEYSSLGHLEYILNQNSIKIIKSALVDFGAFLIIHLFSSLFVLLSNTNDA